MLKTYYDLTKPGIIRGNLLTALAGFLLAAQGTINLRLLLAILAGTTLMIASGCVFNNYLDRHIDKLMARTNRRALVLGSVSKIQALSYATILGLVGFAILVRYTNWLTTLIGLLALFFYVVVYGLAKRRSIHGTIVGSLPGAASIVAGYTAVTGRLDTTSLLLFLIMVSWQMPHFYAIALYRYDDYKTAKLPVLPVKKGVSATKTQIMLYVAGFTIAAAALSIFGYAGRFYMVVALLLGLSWLGFGLKTYAITASKKWGRQMFLFSLVVITVLCLALSIDSFIP